jgi:tripartite-type tricarboxylate transporter receptor subunit TctC
MLLGFRARADDFPSHPLRLILGFAPGGITDFVGRVVAQQLTQEFGGIAVVPENRPGSEGVTAAAYVAHTPADGYTLILIDSGTLVNPMLRADVPYQMTDFTMVGMVGASPIVVVASNTLAAKDIKALIDYGVQNPDKLSFGTAGVGSAPHLAAELLETKTGMKAVHIPYPGIAGAFTDLMAGNIQFAFSSIVGALPFTNDNRVRALATTGIHRPPTYPDVPTVAEAASPGYSAEIWLALAAPKGTPDAVIQRLNAALQHALAEKSVSDRLAKMGIEVRPLSAADTAAFVASEEKRWPAVIHAAGLGPK